MELICQKAISIWRFMGGGGFGGLSDSLNEDLWSLLKLDIINMDDKYVSSELVSEIEKDGVVLYEKV